MAGILYIVGTPIGNLGDFSPRAVDTLNNVDFIACEDTRVSRVLLTHFNIHKPMVSYYEHNSKQNGQIILSRLTSGENAALISDAGMPLISDPGASLVADCTAKGITVTVVPGPSAVTSALALSPIFSGRFCFEGFLSTSRKSRFSHLEQLRTEQRTIVFFEAPHKLTRTLADMLVYFGDRKITICREITKLFEQSLHTSISGAIKYFTEVSPKGEFVLVIDGAQPGPTANLHSASELAKCYISQGQSVRDAARNASEATGISRRDIYKSCIEQTKSLKGVVNMIALASDHAGFLLKKAIILHLDSLGLKYEDYGTFSPESCDYPVYAEAAANAIVSGKCERGILVCGTGAGIGMAANKIDGIRCVICSEPCTAQLSRCHNDSNMLALGARIIGEELAFSIVDSWLNTPFCGEIRHENRIALLHKLESRR